MVSTTEQSLFSRGHRRAAGFFVSRSMPTLYEQLGVSRHASAEEIASAYRQKALIEHPDKNREDEGARERFQALDNVYRVLLDDEKRRAYDASLKGDGPSTIVEAGSSYDAVAQDMAAYIGTAEALREDTGFNLTCTLLGGTRPEVAALRAHETWLQDRLQPAASATGANGYVLLELYEEVLLGGLVLFIASSRRCEDANAMERIAQYIRSAAGSPLAGYKLTSPEDLRTSLGRADPKEPILPTAKAPHGRVLVCVDREAVRALWSWVAVPDCSSYRLIRRAGVRIGELESYVRKLHEKATPMLVERCNGLTIERGLALLGSTRVDQSILDRSDAANSAGRLLLKRGRESESGGEGSSDLQREGLLLKVEDLKHALALAEVALLASGVDIAASDSAAACTPAAADQGNIGGAANPAREDETVGSRKAPGALEPSVQQAIVQGIVKGLHVVRRTQGAIRLQGILDNPGATGPSGSAPVSEVVVRLQTELDACRLFISGLERTCAVLADEVVSLQIVQSQWDAMIRGAANRSEASRTRRGITIPPSVALAIKSATEALARRLCVPPDATQPGSSGGGGLSMGLEVTHLVAAPAFSRSGDAVAWKHDAQALTELKLYLGAWTTGVISTPAKGAAYQVMLEIELGATPAEAHLVGLTSGASRQVFRDQLQAERLEHIYAVELLAATDPAAGYAYDLSVERSTHTAAARWAPDDPLQVLGPIQEADLAALRLCRSGARTSTSVVCLSGMALLDSKRVSHLQVSAAQTDAAAEPAVASARKQILQKMETLQEAAALASSTAKSTADYQEAVEGLHAQYSALQMEYKKTFEGLAKLAPAQIAQHLLKATETASGVAKGGAIQETELPLFLVLLMFCHSDQTAAELAAAVSRSKHQPRMLIVSTTGQWPGSETCHVLQSVLDNVDPKGDPKCRALQRCVKDALKRDYDTATLHSLTQGHGEGGEPEDSWEGLLDFTLISPD